MENKKEQSQTAFDRQASRYDTTCYSRHPRALYPRLLRQIEKLQPTDVLDLGCGTGALLAE
ncbi:MAG: SAM-dependent methyltransferase, partial [Holdemania filiformis]